jgi:hypothetical protein
MNFNSLNTSFEFERLKREIETCTNLDALKKTTICLLSLYYTQKEFLMNKIGEGFK